MNILKQISLFLARDIAHKFNTDYNENCFRQIGENFNRILSRHQLEMKLPFRVKYTQRPIQTKPNFISELPLNIALASIATYLFFIFTNKYFRTKIK